MAFYCQSKIQISRVFFLNIKFKCKSKEIKICSNEPKKKILIELSAVFTLDISKR
jgi:hypothetical protein